MSNINFTEFTWFSPKPKITLAVTIPNQDVLNLNSKLMEQMPKYVVIGAKDAGRILCIREQANTGYRLPKSGTVKGRDLIESLVSMGVRIPARYTAIKEDDCWIATLDKPMLPKVNMKKPPRKPKKDDLQSLRREVEKL